MPHVIAIANPVRQVGKTVTAINLAASLAFLEKKTLLVDCDPLGQAGYGASVIASRFASPGFFGVMTDRSPMSREILATSLDGLKIMPAGRDFSKADVLFADMDGHAFLLRDRIRAACLRFDFVILDVPAAMPNLSRAALLSADWLLVPVNADTLFPYRIPVQFGEIKKLLAQVVGWQAQFGVCPKLAGLLFNKCGREEDLLEKCPRQAQEVLGEIVMATRIPERRELGDAFAVGKPVGMHDIMSFGAMAYMDLALEVMEKLKKYVGSLG